MQPKSRPPPSFIFRLHLGESAVLRRHNGPILSGKWSRHHVSMKIINLLTSVTVDQNFAKTRRINYSCKVSHYITLTVDCRLHSAPVVSNEWMGSSSHPLQVSSKVTWRSSAEQRLEERRRTGTCEQRLTMVIDNYRKYIERKLSRTMKTIGL